MSFFNDRLTTIASQAIRQRLLKEQNTQWRKRKQIMECKIAEIVELCNFDVLLIIRNRKSGKHYIFKSNKSWRPNMEDIMSPYNSCITSSPLIIASLRTPNLRTSFLKILRSLIRRRKGKDRKDRRNMRHLKNCFPKIRR